MLGVCRLRVAIAGSNFVWTTHFFVGMVVEEARWMVAVLEDLAALGETVPNL